MSSVSSAPGEVGRRSNRALGGFGQSKLAEKFDKGIGVPNMARNWNTVLTLAKLARATQARGLQAEKAAFR